MGNLNVLYEPQRFISGILYKDRIFPAYKLEPMPHLQLVRWGDTGTQKRLVDFYIFKIIMAAVGIELQTSQYP